MTERLHLHDSKPSSVLITGPVAFDSIITPYHQIEKVLGGSVSYAALAASYFTKPYILGVVGEDFNETYINIFTKRGIDVSGLEKIVGEKTFFWKGRYFEDFNKRETLTIDLNVFEKFQPKPSDELAQLPYVFLGNTDPELQLGMLDALKGDPFVVVDTIDLWIKKKRDVLLQVLKRANLLLINDVEACALAQEGSVIVAGYKLRELGARTVVIKKGEHGSLLFHESGIFSMPSYPVVSLKDPTGAGDTFAGALIGYLAAVNKQDFFNLKHAVVYATAVASLAVEDLSCKNIESVRPKLIEERYEALINMTTF